MTGPITAQFIALPACPATAARARPLQLEAADWLPVRVLQPDGEQLRGQDLLRVHDAWGLRCLNPHDAVV